MGGRERRAPSTAPQTHPSMPLWNPKAPGGSRHHHPRKPADFAVCKWGSPKAQGLAVSEVGACLNVASRQDTSQTGGRGILPDAAEGSDERDAIGAMSRAKQ
jgi:hypothetical protein